VGLARNQSSPIPQGLLKSNMRRSIINPPCCVTMILVLRLLVNLTRYLDLLRPSYPFLTTAQIILGPDTLLLDLVLLAQLVWQIYLFHQVDEFVRAILQKQMEEWVLVLPIKQTIYQFAQIMCRSNLRRDNLLQIDMILHLWTLT
jgi:hypothetical protein